MRPDYSREWPFSPDEGDQSSSLPPNRQGGYNVASPTSHESSAQHGSRLPPHTSSTAHFSSDQASTTAGEDIYTPIPVHLALTTQSLSRLNLGENQPSFPGLVSHTPSDQASSSQYPSPSPRLNEGTPDDRGRGSRSREGRILSTAPSSTSVSDDEGGDDDRLDERTTEVEVEQAKSWLNMGHSAKGAKGKGKQVESEGMAAKLPPEILIQILHLLPETRDLVSALLVSRSWCACSFSILWSKPHLPKITTLASLVRVVARPKTSLPYSNAVRRLHLPHLSSTLTDELFLGLASCSRLERLTLTGSTNLTAEALMAVIREMPELTSIDLGGIMAVDDEVVETLAASCKTLQAVNLAECNLVGDQGVLALAKHTKLLRRVKFSACHRISERSLVPFVQSCTSLLELDLKDVLAVTDAVVYSVFLHNTYLHDLRLIGCAELTEDCIPNLPLLCSMTDDELLYSAKAVGLKTDDININLLRPTAETSDSLRTVDLTGCVNIGDKTIENLITNAPKLRTLTLAKCGNLTNKSLESVERLRKHLHHLHLGHVKTVTDLGVSKLAKACTRLRYIDLACCENLTDESILELGAMPKLRRVGFVKLVNITDESMYALVERYSCLERVHLSYCENLSVKAITFLLNRCIHLKHISLTGIGAFKKPEFQQFCRAPPDNFTQHQRDAFCVFSGHKVDDLRRYLNETQLPSSGLESDENSTRRDSGSSTSSITLPGGGSPPLLSSGANAQGQGRSAQGYVHRRGSAPALRDYGNTTPGIPSDAFIVNTANFLVPTPIHPHPRAHHRFGRGTNGSARDQASPRHELGDRRSQSGSGINNAEGDANGNGSSPRTGIPHRVREAQLLFGAQTPLSSGMSSRVGSASSQDQSSRRTRLATPEEGIENTPSSGPDRSPPQSQSNESQSDQVRDVQQIRDRDRYRTRPNGPRLNPTPDHSIPQPEGNADRRDRPGDRARTRDLGRQEARERKGERDAERVMPGSFAWNSPEKERTSHSDSAKAQYRTDDFTQPREGGVGGPSSAAGLSTGNASGVRTGNRSGSARQGGSPTSPASPSSPTATAGLRWMADIVGWRREEGN